MYRLREVAQFYKKSPELVVRVSRVVVGPWRIEVREVLCVNMEWIPAERTQTVFEYCDRDWRGVLSFGMTAAPEGLNTAGVIEFLRESHST